MKTLIQLRKKLCLEIAECIEIKFRLNNLRQFDVDVCANLINCCLPLSYNESIEEWEKQKQNDCEKSQGKSSKIRERLEKVLGFRSEDKIDLFQLLEAAIERLNYYKKHEYGDEIIRSK